MQFKNFSIRGFFFFLLTAAACGGGSGGGADIGPDPDLDFAVLTQSHQGEDAELNPVIRVHFNEAVTAIPAIVSIEDVSRQLAVPVRETRLAENATTLEVVLDVESLLMDTRYRVTLRDFESVSEQTLVNGNLTWEFATVDARDVQARFTYAGAQADEARAIAITSDDYRVIVGSTVVEGEAGPNEEALVTLLDGAGHLVWQRVFGSASQDSATAVAVSDDAIYVAGNTLGALEGASAGGDDIFIARYSMYGVREWLTQEGSDADESVSSLAVDSSRDPALPGDVLYAAGRTIANGSSFSRGQIITYRPQQGAVRNTVIPLSNPLANAHAWLNDVAVAANGDVFVVGTSGAQLVRYDGGNRNATPHLAPVNNAAFWFRYSPGALSPIDSMQIDGNGADLGLTLAVADSTDGTRLLIGGSTSNGLTNTGASGGSDGFLVQYAASTAARSFPVLDRVFPVQTDGSDSVESIVAEGETYYYLASSFGAATSSAVYGTLVRDPASGNFTFAAPTVTVMNEFPTAIVVDSSGQVSAAGSTSSPETDIDLFYIHELF